MESCCVCGRQAPPNSGRRQVYPITTSAAHCYRVLLSFSVDQAALLATSSTGIVYSCKRCFSNLEKISHNKAALEQLSDEVKNVLQRKYPSILVKVDAATQTAEVMMETSSVLPETSIEAPRQSFQTPICSRKRFHETDDCHQPPRSRRRLIDTPPSVVKVTSGHRVFSLHTPYKQIVKSLRYNRPGYSTRTFLKAPALKEEVLCEISKDLRRESSVLSSCPLFTKTAVKKLSKLKLREVIDVVKEKAPILYRFLSLASRSPLSKKPVNDFAVCMAIAIIVRERNYKASIFQKVVSSLLYTGHSAKRVYTRLNQLGICTSATTMSRIVKKMGHNHDASILLWKNQCESSSHVSTTEVPQLQCVDDGITQPQSPHSVSSGGSQHSSKTDESITNSGEHLKTQTSRPSYILVMDNLDKNITPRFMTTSHQVQSLHYVNSYGVLDRVPLPLDTSGTAINPKDLPLSTFLLSPEDCVALRKNYIFLVARILVIKLDFFAKLKKCVPCHLRHKYTDEMNVKSKIVPLGIIPKNEAKMEEMITIIEELQAYVPQREDEKFLALGGDQLTVRNARIAQRTRCTSPDPTERLERVIPFALDWHAECNLLQIMFDRLYKGGFGTDQGTLIQLRNAIGRRNVGKDVSKRFNAAIDFFQLTTECFVVSAAMQFFGMNSPSENPTRSCQCLVDILQKKPEEQWKSLCDCIGDLIDRYVLVQHYVLTPDKEISPVESTDEFKRNPHLVRIACEHCYQVQAKPKTVSAKQQHKRRLPPYVTRLSSPKEASIKC